MAARFPLAVAAFFPILWDPRKNGRSGGVMEVSVGVGVVALLEEEGDGRRNNRE